jgi:hypothetical protein
VNYQPLFHIAIEHDYYADKQCSDFLILPDEAGERVMNTHRLLIRTFASGISVLAPLVNEKMVFPVDPSVVFTFRMVLQNEAFHLYTDSSGIYAREETPVFENGKTAELAVKRWDKKIPDVFGLIKIGAVGTMGPTFTYRFAAKKIRWKYLLITDEDPSQVFTIQQGRVSSGETKINFLAPVKMQADDAVARHPQLQGDFLSASKLLIQSKEDVPAYQQARRNIQLKKGEMVLVEHLSNPGPDENGLKVIKYLKNQKN